MYLVLIAGGHAAGKRTVTRDLARKLMEDSSFDMGDGGAEPRSAGPAGDADVKVKVVDLGDYQVKKHEPAVDFAKLRQDLQKVRPSTVVFVHGVYALYDEELNAQARLRIYLDSDADVRLSQWILRDHGHRSLDDILQEYLNFCRPEFLHYIERTKSNADVLLPQGSDRMTIELLAYEVKNAVLKKLNSGTAMSKASTPMINLRAEVASNVEDLYYSTN